MLNLAGPGYVNSFIDIASPSFIDWSSTMLPFLSLHALAALRGDGLRPELLALLERHAGSNAGLAAIIEADDTEPPKQVMDVVPEDPVK